MSDYAELARLQAVNNHLRADRDSYRILYENEREHCEELRARLDHCLAALRSVKLGPSGPEVS